MSLPKRHTLGHAHKLKRRKPIQELFAAGQAFTAYPLRVVYARAQPPQPGHPARMPVQVGVSVSTRLFKRANQRNRIKRLLREAYRKQQLPLQEACAAQGQYWNVFFIYVDKTMPDLPLLADKMRYALGRLTKMVMASPTPPASSPPGPDTVD